MFCVIITTDYLIKQGDCCITDKYMKSHCMCMYVFFTVDRYYSLSLDRGPGKGFLMVSKTRAQPMQKC